MTLTLSPPCEGEHNEDSRSGEFEETRRGWKKCSCHIYASGTLGGKFNRKRTAKNTWEDAKALVSVWEKADSWDGKVALPVAPDSPIARERITVEHAISVFLQNRENAQIAPSTMRKYKTFTKQVATFAASRGYAMLDQFTAGDIDTFYGASTLGARAKGKHLGTLRAFFRFCVNRKWLTENPVSSEIKPPIGANRIANKAPFTDEELQRIVDACDRLGSVTWSTGGVEGVWSGEDVKDFIWVMIYTGLRISDVGLLHMSRLRGNEMFLRAKKNGGDLFTYIPDGSASG